MNQNISLEIKTLKKTLQTSADKTLFETLIENGIRIKTLCAGHGLCGKCKIKLIKGEATPLTDSERRFLSESEIKKGYRLSCQVKPLSDLVIEIPKESLELRPKIVIKGISEKFKIDPNIIKVAVAIDVPKEETGIAIFDLISDGIKRVYPDISTKTIPLDIISKISKLFSEGKRSFSITISQVTSEIIDIEDVEKINANYGIAVDIGTTTLVASLIDLNSGNEIDVTSMLNPQISLGEDIISRISYAQKSEKNLKQINNLVIKGINDLTTQLIRRNNIELENIKEFVAVGNSVMIHLFLCVNPESLGRAPFMPVFRGSTYVSAKKLGLKGNENARVYTPPLIAGYIGSDITAGIIATGIYKHPNKIEFLIDIGTNGEIVLNKRGELIATSFAAGAAFEGAKIKFGTRASDGAIEDVKIDPNTFDVKYSVIGDMKPIGLCGTGIINAIAEMVKVGVIDNTGRFNVNLNTERIRKGDDYMEFVIAYANETAIGKDIVLTQKDIREIQLAKAAAFAATCLLLRYVNVKPEEVDTVYVAGGFGSNLRVDSIKTIGLLPNVPNKNIKPMGNTALAGAKMFLLSKRFRMKIEPILRKIRYVNLGGHKDFYKELVDAMYFPHKEKERFQT